MTLLLTIAEIKEFIEQDKTSSIKSEARKGQDYYEGRHDILSYRMFYYNDSGDLVEDKYRSNCKIAHRFFTELVNQGTEYIMSGVDDFIIRSDDTELQKQLDIHFNKNRKFLNELAETITGMQAKGFDYMYAYKDKDDRLAFENADCLGVIEVEGRFAEDGKDQRIYRYLDRIDKDGKEQWKILVIDDTNTYYYIEKDNGDILSDENVAVNPKPHALYLKKGKLYVKDLVMLPFFRLDFDKNKTGLLPYVKPQIDDYDLMNSSLSNNLADFDTPLHVVRGFKGDNLDQLQQNLKTKKMIGVSDTGGVEVHTVEIPYQARKEKMEIDEKNIYRFGMGMNTAGLKDSNATTNLAIMQSYALLDLRCKRLVRQIEMFLQPIVELVLEDINKKEKKGYKFEQVWFNFKPKVMSNDLENAQKALTEAQKQQTKVNLLLSLEPQLGHELLMKQVCEELDWEYEELKAQFEDPEEAVNSIVNASLEEEPIVK